MAREKAMAVANDLSPSEQAAYQCARCGEKQWLNRQEIVNRHACFDCGAVTMLGCWVMALIVASGGRYHRRETL